MLQVEIDDVRYDIRWCHERMPVLDDDGNQTTKKQSPIATHCRIKLHSSQGLEQQLLGAAKCHEGDVYEYDRGRKISLARAMTPLSREIRSIIWRHYHSLVGPLATSLNDRAFANAMKRVIDAHAYLDPEISIRIDPVALTYEQLTLPGMDNA